MSERPPAVGSGNQDDEFAFVPKVPKTPAECKRHHWSQRMNLRTGEMLNATACWHCGTPGPAVDE
jgi:hypothetical protein